MGKKQAIRRKRKRKSEAICSTSSNSGKSDTPQTPIKSITATPSDSKILRCSPRRRRSSSSNNNNNNIKAEAEDGVALVDGQQEREAAAAAADPKSKKKDKKRKMQQTASASASAAAEKSRQQEQEEEEAAAAAAAAADHPKLTKKKDEKRKMQQPASLSPSAAAAASAKEKSSCFTTSIWSVEDEIKVLQGIMDDAKRNNGLPLHYNKKNAETFLAAIAPSLGIHPTVHQLERKIRYMKETYANAPPAKKSKATGHKKLLYDLCDKIWLSSNCYAAEAEAEAEAEAAAATEKAQEKDDDSKSKGDYNYPELKIAVERQAGYLVFDEVVAALGEEKARHTDEQFGKLRKKEKKQWKLIHECL